MKFDAEKALKHQIVLLAGAEPVLRREALNKLVKLASDGDEFDTVVFTADSTPVSEWIGNVCTAPFLSPRRVVVVRQLLRNDGWEQLSSNLPESALLILVADDEPSEDQYKASKAQTAMRNWKSSVTKAKGMVSDLSVDSKTLMITLKDDAKANGKDLTTPAATALREMCGDSYSRAVDELQKIYSFLGDRSRITEDDVRQIVVPSREWNIFKLLDAVVASDSGGALRQLQILIGSSSKAEAVAFSTILPQLSRTFRLILQARMILDAKADASNVPPDIARLLPTKNNLLQEKEYPRTKAFQGAAQMSLRQVSECLVLVADTDAKLKGLGASYSGYDTLQRLVLDMIEVIRPRKASIAL